MRRILVTLSLCLALGSTDAAAHSWYDRDCCSNQDCGPVDKVERGEREGKPGRWMENSRGRVFVPDDLEAKKRRSSKDQDIHVCTTPGRSDWENCQTCDVGGGGPHETVEPPSPFRDANLLCIYEPAGA